MAHKNNQIRSLWAFALLMLECAGGAWAGPITVSNPSFEDPALPLGASNAVIPGWTITGSWGVFHPTTGMFPSVPDGLQTAYSNNGTLSQTLAETFLANTEYSLTVYVGRRLDLPDLFPGYSVALYAGNFLLQSKTYQVGGPSSAPLPNPGEFLPVTVTYTSLAADPRHIKIVLDSLAIQTNFDKVSLESRTLSSNIPEPNTGLLMLPGLVWGGILAYNKRERGKVR